MYQVINQGQVITRFNLFIDAWLFAYLDMSCFSHIVGYDGLWVVNPPLAN